MGKLSLIVNIFSFMCVLYVTSSANFFCERCNHNYFHSKCHNGTDTQFLLLITLKTKIRNENP